MLTCATELSSPAGFWDQSFQPMIPGPLGSVDVSQGPSRVEGEALGGTFNCLSLLQTENLPFDLLFLNAK